MIVFNRVSIAAAIDGVKTALKNVWSAWDQNGEELLGVDYFRALDDLVRACDPQAALTVSVVQGDGLGVVTDPLHVGVRILKRRIHLSFTSVSLSGSPHYRAVGARIVGCLLLLSRMCVDPEATGADFTLGLLDQGHGASVAFCGTGDCVLIPDSEYLESLGYWSFRRDVDAKWEDWRSRQNRLFWRGSTTGVPRPVELSIGADWARILPRTEVCNRLQQSRLADHCDVGISMIVQLSDEGTVNEIYRNLLRPRVERSDQIGFRFQLDIDGNSNAWAGLFQALLMGSCVLKVESEHEFRQWYYDRLVPGQHYVPIASDLSDLEMKVEWALTHEDECQSIAAAGFALSREMTVDRELDRSVKELCARFSPASARPTA